MVKTITQADLYKELAKRAKISRKEAETITKNLFETMKSALFLGKKIVVSGFGTFEMIIRPEHKARNPKTQEQITVIKKRIPKFTASPTWLRQLQDMTITMK